MNDTKTAVAIFIRGLPGSGKSFISDQLKHLLGDGATLIDPDLIDRSAPEYLRLTEELENSGVDSKFFPYRFLRAKAHKSIEDGRTFVWCQAFTNLEGFNKTIINLTAHAEANNVKLKLFIIEVEIDEKLAKQRVKERVRKGGLDVDDETFARFIADYRTFSDDGYQTLRLDGSAPAELNLSKITQYIDLS